MTRTSWKSDALEAGDRKVNDESRGYERELGLPEEVQVVYEKGIFAEVTMEQVVLRNRLTRPGGSGSAEAVL